MPDRGLAKVFSRSLSLTPFCLSRSLSHEKGFLVTDPFKSQLSKLIFILKMFTLLVKEKVCLIIFSRQAADPV